MTTAYRNRRNRRRFPNRAPVQVQPLMTYTWTAAATYLEFTFDQGVILSPGAVLLCATVDRTAVIATAYTQTASNKVRAAMPVNLTAADYVLQWQPNNANLRSTTGAFADSTFKFSPLPP